ncbi:hypothetical protein PHLGIDRAFT_26528 [Phlebiopsis gigantea 11061_1 CR5-6]|uniref:TauD/TfdA-like domain-containing protein n=1 Tax=Phlebiopsis gigantea (strain 11061_1 CR5-6) TaxID=745531 RepID=A0A0C3NDF4_PHLG1|nr:hypothetical protein PHLGIDRAFT_26528 [Phlebiopsis gigantea 11061_1 CR5-6]
MSRSPVCGATSTTYPFRWLRDSCQCPKCVHPSTRQKLHQTSEVYQEKPLADTLKVTEEGVHVNWGPEHESFYPAEFLERYSSQEKLRAFHRDVEPVPWDNSRISSSSELFIEYDQLNNPAGLLSALTHLTRYGLVFVTGVPVEKTSNEECEAGHLAKYFSELRETFYGPLWDVMNVRDSKNIAYTNLDLGLHMDLLYFQHPPRYQLLHCLRNRVQGGTSVFVDALHAANRFRESHPADFDILTKTLVPFHYINNDNHLHHEHPTIELDASAPEEPGPKPVQFINFSPPFQAPLPASTPPEFYAAFARFAELLHEPEAVFAYTLKEGDAVLFDNRRVLHARTAFNDIAHEDGAVGETNRWLKGCYLEADAVLNRRRVLQQKIRSLAICADVVRFPGQIRILSSCSSGD